VTLRIYIGGSKEATPTTIQELERRRADGRPMTKPVWNDVKKAWVDAGNGQGPAMPLPERPAPVPRKGRRRLDPAASKAAQELARRDALSAKLREIATQMLAEVEPVHLRDLATAVGISPSGVGRACKRARIQTRRINSGSSVVVRVLP
jgi:hypothetical protein